MIKENTMLIKKKRKIYDKYLRRFSCSNKWYVMTIILLLIIILSFQIIILNIGFDKSKKTNNKKIKERLFLFKEDKNNSKDTNKFKIHIVMSIDNNGIYISLVSMTSALENNNKEKNILIYHLLLSHDFNKKKIEYFESLKEKYDFRINYYNISNIFNKYKKWRYSSTIYFKLLIPLIFPDYERIIFLDADTLIFKDISEMFNLPFNDNYVLGYPFHTPWMVTINGKHPKIYINSGVLLININKIRKDYKDIELIQFTLKNSEKLFFPEQDGMNYIFHEKIGLLPLKYGIYLYGNITEYQKEYSYKLNIKLDLKELEKAIEDPSIVHLCCCNPKVWYNSTKHENHFHHICKRFQNEFYFYANKTKFYDTIYNNYMK
jgi:lipopolysaccharide biosynthesis glycosyltransferase